MLLQGGHNPALPLDYYLTIVRETLRRFPQVTPHFFTASEIQTVAEVSGLAMTDVLDRLKDAGQRTLPGGGAEVLSERVRKRIEPKKGGPEAWLDGAPRGASPRVQVDGHHDVRPRRRGRRRARSLRRDPRPAGRVRRLHGVRAVVVQAEQHAAREVDQAATRGRTPISGCSPPHGSTSTTSLTCRRRGSRRASRPARSRCTSAPTTGAARCSRRTCTRPPRIT